jgi:putrescine transport system substrate-binding protein
MLSHAQQTENRVALVIGNSAYKSSPLKNPVNDASDMSARLKGFGFIVIERNNLTTKQIGSTLREFRSKLTPGSVALVFYAGHGVTIKGKNYLPAIDAEINGEEDVPNQSLGTEQIMDVLADAKTRLNLVFLDACRDNPYARSFRSTSRGLSRENAPSGTLISFATKPGSVAADGTGRNGLYTSVLLEQLKNSNQPIEQVLKKVVSGVRVASKNQQEPWMEGSIEGDFCFGGCGQTAVSQVPAELSESQKEDSFWNDAKAAGNIKAFEAYLKKYPKGRYLELALANIDRLTLQPLQPEPTNNIFINREEKILNIYNWPDYVANDLIENFEKKTGIKVNYQTFENNETLQAKLVQGNTGFDIVVPGAVFVKAQIEAGLYRKLDKSQIPNYKNLDTSLMSKLTSVDPGNEYVIPWAWSFTTVAINKVKVAKALGSMPMPENAWDLVFNPTYTSKLKSCGIAYLDSPTEILPPALHYIGKKAYSEDAADHKAAGEMLAKVRKDIRLFSSTMIDDMASGKACVALGWAGDFTQAAYRAVENKSGVRIEVMLPKTGGLIFFDTIAVPADAKHPNNAMAFINYYLDAKVSASMTNQLGYPTANKASLPYIDTELANDKTIFPDQLDLNLMVNPNQLSYRTRESMIANYTKFKRGQ